MKIALVGYGKMGKEIEQIAISRGHEIVLKVNSSNAGNFTNDELKMADVAIEFSVPQSAINNINRCIDANIPVIVGTTAWLDKKNEVIDRCIDSNGTLLYSSNFSIGVNLFFQLNKKLAELMKPYHEYEVSMKEIHHVHKLDAPSGTAITLANSIIEELPRKNKWVVNTDAKSTEIEIRALRTNNIPGTHSVMYNSAVDSISIEHIAHNRKGFALGAVIAAEYLQDKKGIYTMHDVLK